MWISLLCTLVITLLITVIEGITKQRPCCTGLFARSSYTNHWHKGLQEAVYHSLTQHSAFDGSLDDRVERDRRLWKRIQAAEYSPELSTPKDSQIGLLVNAEHILEFHPSSYTCRQRDCKKSIMAIWEMRKTDHPRGYYIIVKLPVSHTYIEDSYEYTAHDGLKHLGAENVQKQHVYHYTIENDGKNSFKQDQRRVFKPMKFPTWNKSKSDYDATKKDTTDLNKNHDKSKEDYTEDEDQIVRIEPRRKFQYAESLKPKKQGLVLAYVPENSQREFQIPEQKYNGFIPLIHSLSKEIKDREIFRQTSNDKEYDLRRLKVYEDVIQKYINEQQNKPKISPDFRPSRPYIQYSEPDPLYIRPGYETPNEEQKPNIDANKFLIIHKYPDSVNSQLPVGNIAGTIPTVPYISVTVSNKIPVQNFNHIDLATTAKTLSSTSTTTTMPESIQTSSQSVLNATNKDVELITQSDATGIPTRQPPKTVATNAAPADVSKEELTTTFQPTTLLAKGNSLELSNEDRQTATPQSMQRNLIKKDTTSNTGNIENKNSQNDAISDNINVNNVTLPQYSSTTETTPAITSTMPTDTTMSDLIETTEKIQNKINETNQIVQTKTDEETTPKFQTTSKQNIDLLVTDETPTLINNSLSDDHNNKSKEKIKTLTTEDQSTTQVTTETTMVTTTSDETTTNYYIEEARSQLADLFASITFDLFNSPPPSIEVEEESPNYSVLLSTPNQSDSIYNTNYDDFLNEELAEPSNQNQQSHPSSIDQKSNKNTSRLLSSRQYTNSH